MINSQNKEIQSRNLVKTSIISFVLITVIFSSALCQGQSVEPTLLAPSKNLEPLSNDKTQGAQSRPSDFPSWMQAKPPKPPLPVVNPPPPTASVRTPIRINVEELEKIDSDSVGILTEEQGGFGFNMWEGTNRSLVEKLLTKLPVNSSSRTIRALMRRLLLSVAKSPTKIAAIDKALSSPVSPLPANGMEADGKLLIMRIERLSAMGDISAVYNLLKVAPNRATDPILLKHEADVLFLSNDNSRACDLVLRQISNLEVSYWQKASIYCQALSGNHDQANLGANLLREIGEQDEVFFGLINSLTGIEEYTITSLSNPTPLHFSMIRAAKIKLPKDITSSNDPVVLKTIATSPNAEPALRVETAERAEILGVLDVEVLRQIYAGVTFTQEVLDNAFVQASKDRTALSRALLYRKAMVESIPSVKVEILSQVFELARETGKFQLTARVYYDILKNLPVTQDLVWFAPDAVRALLVAGDGAAAQIWFDTIEKASLDDKQIILLRDKLLPLVRLSGKISGEEWDATKIGSWWNAVTKSHKKSIDADPTYAHATLLYNLLEALGDEVPSHLWLSLIDGPPRLTTVMPRSALWEMLNQATTGGKRAEAVLVALLVLGEWEPTQINPIVLRHVIVSLKKVGLSAEARSLALEAAIVAGL
jgi:hypothetical protein